VAEKPTRRQLLYELDLDIFTAWLKEHRQPAYRARQIFSWAYERSADCFADMSDLPGALRELLALHFDIGPIPPQEITQNPDTTKLLLPMADGALVECVRTKMDDAFTGCVSSQVGCGVRWAF